MTMHLPYRAVGVRDDYILTQLMKDIAAHSEYVAVCLIPSVAHGYEIENLLVQLHDGSFIHQYWSDMSSTEDEAIHLTGIELDLITELHELRESQFLLRGPLNESIGGMTGRCVQMYLATAQEGEWLSCLSPLRCQTYESNPITRICWAIGWQIILI